MFSRAVFSAACWRQCPRGEKSYADWPLHIYPPLQKAASAAGRQSGPQLPRRVSEDKRKRWAREEYDANDPLRNSRTSAAIIFYSSHQVIRQMLPRAASRRVSNSEEADIGLTRNNGRMGWLHGQYLHSATGCTSASDAIVSEDSRASQFTTSWTTRSPISSGRHRAT
jgi:hypothetical protein